MDSHQEDLQLKIAEILEITPDGKDITQTETTKHQTPLIIKGLSNKKPTTENVETNLLFDSLDTEGRDLIDIYQIRKYLELSSVEKKPIYLLEKDIRQYLNEMTSLSKPYCVKRSEFELFLKYIKDRQNDLNELQQPCSLLKAYSKFYSKFQILKESDEKPPHLIQIKREDLPSELDKYHNLVCRVLFKQPKWLNTNKQWNGIIPNDYFNSKRFENTISQRLPVPLLRRRNVSQERPELLFELFNPLYQYKDPAISLAGIRPINELTTELPKLHAVRLKSISFGGEDAPEPLRFILSVYDSNSREKITEDLVIEKMEIVHLMYFLKGQIKGSDIILVVRVLRKSGDDIVQARELYAKGFEDKKGKKKMIERKYGNYWQQLMIGFVSLKGELEKKNGNLPVQFYKIETDNESIWDVYQSQFKGKKQIESAKAQFEFSEFDSDIQLINGKYKFGKKNEGDSAIVLDNLLMIKQTEDLLYDYYNRLYIYPLEISFGKEKKRNPMVVSVQLMNNGKPVKSFYKIDKISFEDNNISSLSGSKQIQFNDEFKLELPFPLNENYQLIFNVQEIHEGNSIKKELFGIVKLYENGHIAIQPGKLTLQLASSIEQAMKYDEENKKSLTVFFNLYSTVYPSSPIAHDAINKLVNGKIDNTFNQIPLIDIIHFLPHILTSFLESKMVPNKDVLFILMKTICGHCNSSEKRNQTVETYITHYCSFETQEIALNLIKTCNLIYKFDEISPQTEIFKHCWLVLELLRKSIQQTGADENFWSNAINFIKTFGDTIRGHVIKKEILGMEEGNAHMSYFIRTLIEMGYKAEGMKLMEEYLNHLTWPYDQLKRGKKLEYNSPEMVALEMIKTQFLAVFEGSLNLYEASNPGNVDVSDIVMLDDLLWTRHFPIAFLMRQHMLLLGRSEEINRISLYLMVGLVSRLDLDANLQGQQKEFTAAMFLPFVMQFLENFENFAKWKFVPFIKQHEGNKSQQQQQRRSLSFKLGEISGIINSQLVGSSSQTFCGNNGTPIQNVSDMEMLGLLYVWVLKNLNKEMLKEWIENEVPSRLETLIKIMTRFCLLYSYFPLQETIDVYEEIDRNIKLIVNGLKEHMYYMAPMPKFPGMDFGDLIGNVPEQKFEIPVIRSLRPMRTDDSSHNKLHKVLSTEVVKVCLDMFSIIFDSLLKQESFEQLEYLKGIIATKLFEEHVVNDDVFVFVKNLLMNYRTNIFSGSEDFSVKLLSSLIKLFQSNSAQLRGRGVELLYLYIKNNFIETNTISRSISLMATAVVEAGDIAEDRFNASVEALDTTHIADVENTTLSVNQIKKNLLIPNINSLKARKTIIRTESLGDIEAFVILLKQMIELRIHHLKIIKELPSTPVNGYSKMIEEILEKPFFITQEMVGVVEEIMKKYSDLNVSEQVNKTVDIMRSKWNEMKSLEIEMVDISQTNKITENEVNELCIKVRDQCAKGIIWALLTIKGVIQNEPDLNKNYIISQCKTETCNKESEELIQQYKTSLKIIESNPLFPVGINEFNEIINGANLVQIKYSEMIKKLIDNKKKYQIQEQEINHENASNIQILKETLEEIIFGLDESTTGICSDQLKELTVPQVTERDKSLKGTFCIPFEFFEDVLPLIITTLSKVEKIIEKACNNQQRLEKAEEWFKLERSYITDCLMLKEQIKTIKYVAQIPIHENGAVTPFMCELAQIIKEDGTKLSSTFENLTLRRKRLNAILNEERLSQTKTLGRRKTTRKSLMIQDRQMKLINAANEEEEKINVFGCVEGENQIIGKMMDEMEKEIKRIEKKVVIITEKWILVDEKEKGKIELRKEAIELWNQYKSQGRGSWNELKKLLNEEIDEVIDYDNSVELYEEEDESKPPISLSPLTRGQSEINLSPNSQKHENNTSSKCSVNKRSSTSGFVTVEDLVVGRERQNTKISKQVKKQYHKSKSTIAISGPVTEMAVVQDFIDEKCQFVEDAFIDVNLYRLSQYKSVMRKLQKDITQILVKLNDLKKIKESTRDPDAYCDRSFTFAHGYLDTPRLHLKWFEKIAEEQSVRQHYIEAGLCEIHMICFIASFLEGGEAFNSLNKITDIGDLMKNKRGEEVEGCTEQVLFNHVNLAYKYFSIKKICDLAEALLLAVIEYLNKRKEYKRLDEYHKKLTVIYSMKDKHEEGQKHFYLVGFYGNTFDKLNEKEFIYQTHETYDAFSQEIKAIVPIGRKNEVQELKEGQCAVGLPLEEIHIRITEVHPVFENDNDFTTNTFAYEFLRKEGNGGIDETSKRRIIYCTKQPLPSVLRRQQIESKLKDSYLSPIETCMDNIDILTEKLQNACVYPITEELTTSLKQLLLGENGPSKIVDVFLIQKVDNFIPDQIMELWELITNMMKCIATALPIHLRNFPNNPFYGQFITAFNNLEKIIISITPKIESITQNIQDQSNDDLM
ncbi:hypothetical protein ENUP19_0049G0021 [Entamoeba nuttalli]|uniref:Dedicator of cytokinesis protein n=2 Tax=Entamoeba nuttalli TaxID=412467 RepID=K2GCL0_ENTNP|nr:hypothetical protein ENU1_095790 [Entamoeba nuttalli P19]EKE40276.1 hypothetical protein ENU1_095790 [Entamoeba nuttalli P19]|eukprot:XP_008857380.1 hypothetical protein ENU1_095790 [Entamoeba nuttalli P19]